MQINRKCGWACVNYYLRSFGVAYFRNRLKKEEQWPIWVDIQVCKYFPKPQVMDNIACECNVYPYCPLTKVMSCLQD